MMTRKNTVRIIGAISIVLVVAIVTSWLIRSDQQPIAVESTGEETLEIVTLLPRDAIPALDDPQFVSGDAAVAIYQPDELVLGVEIDGDARAYSIPFLSGHEIVNDEVSGVPIAVTW